MLKSEAAAYLAGVTQTEGAEASAPTNLHVITGEVGEASADGKTLVKIDGLMFSESDDQFIEVDALGGLEEGDIATIVLTGEQGHAMTPLALGSIGSVDRITVRIAAIEADYIKVEQLDAAEARIGELEADHVSVDDLNATTARIGTLETTRATITDLEAATARIHSLEVDHVTIDNFEAATARIDDLEADHVSTDDLDAATARIGTLETNTADIGTIRANSAKVQNLTAAELEADHATVGSLSTTYATIANLNAANGRITNLESTKANISDLEADYITADEIEATYMHANMSNSDVAWIQNGTIKDGAIVSAMINDVSANKLTAGTINGSVINVTNLNADNITTGTINGQRIGEGSLSLSKLEDDVYTESEVDAKLATMQAEIDGAIETWTGTSVPTLNNSPASNWTTAAVRDTHVGDVYFVVNSQSQQNGYNYRFTKSGSTYSWQLIKDSDVTNALQRLETAEGKITTFDSDISTLKTDTGSLTTRTTNLETRMSDAENDILDKVDTTTFNEVSDTVDQHSQTISQHTTAIANKADSSTVTAVTNRVSKNEQDISGINTSIGELQETVESKADGSTVSTISNKLNTVSDTVDGHTQTLTSVQNTLSTKADSSTVSTLTTKVNNVSDTVDGHTSQLSSITTTQTTMQSTLDKTVKSSIQLWYSKANTTAPSKPTSQVTSTSTSGNAWRIVVPAYNASYPHYYYCWQYEYVDGTYGWSAVVRDIAMGESQSTARTADSNASAAVTTANTANTNASTALTTANTANTNASDAKTAAATASTTASEAKTTAETAASDASTAKTNAASAVSTANSASTTATNAQSTANANIKSSVQLWFTKANSTAPNKPTSVVSTSNANTANAWNLVVPVWNKTYPHYFYCYQQQKGDGTYQWTDVVYDRATSEAQQLANTTSTNLSTLQTNYATFKQQTEQFESTVGTTYATKTELKGATDDITELESRVSTNETSISNNASAIALKANASDVYTKTAVDGKITQEVSDRNAAITAKANEITSTVSETYATKMELNDAVDNRVDVDGEFLYRTTGGGQDVPSGRATVQSVKGNTLVWNQLYSHTSCATSTKNGVTLTNNSDGSFTVSGTASAKTDFRWNTLNNYTFKANHRYLVRMCPAGGSSSTYQSFDSWSNLFKDTGDGYVTVVGDADKTMQPILRIASGATINATNFYPMFFDLTQMFGSGNEPATVAEFEALFPEPYYPYDAGSLLPVKMEGIESVGFNQWDEEWELGAINTSTGEKTSATSSIRSKNYTPVIPNTNYYFKCPTKSGLYARLFWYDADYNFISYNNAVYNVVKTAPPNARYMLFLMTNVYGTTYNNDICVNLSDTALNGQYKPYMTNSVEWPAQTLRAAGSVRDELTAGELVTRVGVVVADGVNVKVYSTSQASGRTHGLISMGAGTMSSNISQVLISCDKLPAMNSAQEWTATLGICVGSDRFIRFVTPEIAEATSAADLNAWLQQNPLTCFYALATPTTTEIDPPLNMTYRADSGGTERIMVDATISAPQSAPVPMSIQYGINIYETAAEDAMRTASIESRVTTAESTIEQHGASIALKANSADVYTKQQSDGMISTEVTNRNAAISAATDAINLSVSQTYTTKTEFSNLEIGGRNLFVSSLTSIGYPTDKAIGTQYGITGMSGNHEAYQLVPVEEGSSYVFQYWVDDSEHQGWICIQLLDSEGIVVSKLNRMYPKADYWTRTFTIPSGVTTALVSGRHLAAGYEYAKLKFEKGTKPTDWTPAPEDLTSYTDSQIESAKAAIKVTTDGISTEVAKKVNSTEVISSINQSAETVKIQASRVEIDGAAVFSAISSDVDDAITDKGYATTTQAQGYATSAKTEAVNAAAADATSKANAAEAAAKAAIPSDISELNNDTGFITSADVPTKVSELTNDSGFQNSTQVNTAITSKGYQTSSQVESAITSKGYQTSSQVNSAITSKGYQTSSQVESAITSKGYATTTQAQGYASTAKSEAISAAATDATTKANVAEANAKAYTNALEIGGRNLLQDSDQVLENGSVLDTKTLFACFLWSTPAKGYTGYKQIMPNTNVNSAGRFALTFEAMNVSQEYWCIKHNGTQHDYVRYFKNSVDVEQGDVLTLSFDVVKFNPSVANGLEIKNFKLERGNKATDWTPAPEDIEANAVKRTQRIYYRSSASTAPATMPTAWVTETNNKWAKNNSTVANWSTKVTPIANGTGATAEKYLYLWTCEQREMANGTLAYTNVLLDDSTTVIDGGNIITNSITANQIAANAVTADKLAANSLTIGKFTDADKAKVDNSYMQVGGRNLLLWSGEDDVYSAHSAVDRRWDFTQIYGTNVVNGNTVTFTKNSNGLTNNTSGIRVSAMLSDGRKATETNLASLSFGLDLKAGDELTFSCDVKTSGNRVAMHAQYFNGTDRWKDCGAYTEYGAPVDTDWHRYSHTFTIASNYVSLTALGIYCELKNGVTISAKNFKLERGNKPTDWTRAQEDTTASVDQTYVQNLTPYFQMDMSNNADEYWTSLTVSRTVDSQVVPVFTKLDDGWAHFECTNTGSDIINNYIRQKAIETLVPGGKYTLLVEFRNVSISATGGSFYSQQGDYYQIWGTENTGGFSIPNATIRALQNGSGVFYKSLTLLTEDSKDPTGTVRGKLPKSHFMSINQQVAGGQTISYDVRISLYADGYTGVYKPYVGPQLYATGKSLSDSQDFLDERIDGLDDRTTNAENSLETTSEGLEKAVKDIASLNKKYTDEKALRDQWMDFTRSEGLVIGDNQSAFKTMIGSESMEFKNGDITLAKASGTEFGADVMRSEELHIGKWMWTKRNEGNNLSLKWVGN